MNDERTYPVPGKVHVDAASPVAVGHDEIWKIVPLFPFGARAVLTRKLLTLSLKCFCAAPLGLHGYAFFSWIHERTGSGRLQYTPGHTAPQRWLQGGLGEVRVFFSGARPSPCVRVRERDARLRLRKRSVIAGMPRCQKKRSRSTWP